ncbi:protein CROWDED NUCLEI 4-like [Ananas comosus]|uniref:Protein CROWDED NUCLEI 4-like n=1 Tax=Ananas comosus TaxID=4615 RepID=A0A6P5F8H4_ANACO|nr:protein CROWDED NUCLEI 4-like [Ananas comosus]
MASPRLRVSPVAATSLGGGGGGGDEALWKRLVEAGFDEESVRRRDKAALIAYIAKLESEIYDYQHHMGLLIMEKKEWTSKCEQVKASTESSAVAYNRERVAQLSALAEAKKREENLRKALDIEKECVVNVEKALHEVRAELAEIKVAYERKLAETHLITEVAQRKFEEAEKKLLAAKSLEADAKLTRDAALRSLHDVEAREDDLRRRLISFESECEAKENEISFQRKFLNDSQRVLHEEEERLLEKQALLNQREECIFDREKELIYLEKRLEDDKSTIVGEFKALKEEKATLDLKIAALAAREDAIVRRESLLDKRERELLILQETIACKEHAEIQKLIDEQEAVLGRRKEEFETEMEKRRKLVEDEMEAKRIFLDHGEADLNERANSIQEKEQAIELQLFELAEKQEDIAMRSKQLEEEKENLEKSIKASELELKNIQREREDIAKLKMELEKAKTSLEEEKIVLTRAQENLEITREERNEVLDLEKNLKEEIDSLRAQKMELLADADRLQAEKERFEIEWDLIDEKKEELKKEVEMIAEERKAVAQYLKNEKDSIKQEKDNLRSQYMSSVESLSREREEFMSHMQREHSNWLSKIQQEREDFTRDINIQRKDLQNSFYQRRAELETWLRENDEAFTRKLAEELKFINSQKKTIEMQLEHVASELQKLDNERKEIALEREQRERELLEIKSSVEVLNAQREKLQKQRELLHADREAISQQIEQLKELQSLDIETETRVLSMAPSNKESAPMNIKMNVGDVLEEIIEEQNTDTNHESMGKYLPEKTSDASVPESTPLSWIRKYTKVIFQRSPENNVNSGSSEHSQSKNLREFVKVTEDSRTDLLELDMISNMSPFTQNVESISKMEGQTDMKISQLGEGVGETTRTVDKIVPSLGRKRLNGRFSRDHTDMQLEPSRKNQKMSAQKGDDNGLLPNK